MTDGMNGSSVGLHRTMNFGNRDRIAVGVTA